jgi:hypothetical protein
MDISKITDIKELKALAYDELAKQQQAEVNLRALSQRIAELSEEEAKEK